MDKGRVEPNRKREKGKQMPVHAKMPKIKGGRSQ
jgi:hypothetical protein